MSLLSCTLIGIEPQLVTCEVDLSPQLPAFTLVGLPSSVTQESRERVRAAVQNSGFEWPARKITISLLPAALPKWGSHFEVGMALGILSHSSMSLGSENGRAIFAFGELSLSGSIRPTRWLVMIRPWLLRYAATCEKKLALICHPEDAGAFADDGFEILSASNLKEARDQLTRSLSSLSLEETKTKPNTLPISDPSFSNSYDLLSKVRGEPLGVLSALVAIAGRFHLLLAGPQGSGKSMIAKAICQATPVLSQQAIEERAALLGSFGEDRALSPISFLQTSITRAALEGSLRPNGQAMLGEFTRAHCGILVADEFLEYRRDVVESFRQPMEERIIRLQRAQMRALLPADFQLIATTNLCPCGLFGSERYECRCNQTEILKYTRKFSGPVQDRFPLTVIMGRHVPTVWPKGMERVVEDFLASPHLWPEKAQSVKEVPMANDGHRFSENSFYVSYRAEGHLGRVLGVLGALLDLPASQSLKNLVQMLRVDLKPNNINGVKINARHSIA